MHLERDNLRRPGQRIVEPTTTPRHPLEHISGLHTKVVHLARQRLILRILRAVRIVPENPLPRARPRLAAIDAPRLGQPPVIMDRHLAVAEEAVQRALRIAAAKEARAAAVRDALVGLDEQREVQLDGLGRDALDGREEAVAVGPVADGARRHPAEADLVQQEPIPRRLEARVEEVRRVGEAGGGAVGGVALAEEGLDDVHDAAEEVRAAGQRGGPDGPQDRAFRDAQLDEVVEAVVDDAVRVVDGEEEVADEHLEHGRREVEVDGRFGLRAGAVPVEDQAVILLLHGTGDHPGADALAVVVDEVGEATVVVVHLRFDDLADG